MKHASHRERQMEAEGITTPQAVANSQRSEVMDRNREVIDAERCGLPSVTVTRIEREPEGDAEDQFLAAEAEARRVAEMEEASRPRPFTTWLIGGPGA